MLHKWTNGGEYVLALRAINPDGTSGPDRDFKNPLNPGEKIAAPDWDPKPVCGNGIHAWPWGKGRVGKYIVGKIFQVVRCDPELGVDLSGKAKWPEVEIVMLKVCAKPIKNL